MLLDKCATLVQFLSVAPQWVWHLSAKKDILMYEETTRSIRITVKPFYLDDQSSPEDEHYVFAYQVKIENQGGETVQLRNRYWQITDGHGRQQEDHCGGRIEQDPPGGKREIHARNRKK